MANPLTENKSFRLGEMGGWGDGETGRRGDGETGGWGVGRSLRK
ncbi:hypothetical protein [Crocosphaera watsonii]|nr:hypothetical protein [Crocosphaera watsonii]